MDDGTEPVAFDIKFRGRNVGETFEASSNCSSTAQGIVQSKQCTIDMYSLTIPPINLILKDDIHVSLKSIFPTGTSSEVEFNSTIKIQTAPDAPAAPLDSGT